LTSSILKIFSVFLKNDDFVQGIIWLLLEFFRTSRNNEDILFWCPNSFIGFVPFFNFGVGDNNKEGCEVFGVD